MLKTAQEMLEMGFKLRPLTLGLRHDPPLSHQALKGHFFMGMHGPSGS